MGRACMRMLYNRCSSQVQRLPSYVGIYSGKSDLARMEPHASCVLCGAEGLLTVPLVGRAVSACTQCRLVPQTNCNVKGCIKTI